MDTANEGNTRVVVLVMDGLGRRRDAGRWRSAAAHIGADTPSLLIMNLVTSYTSPPRSSQASVSLIACSVVTLRPSA